MISHHKWHGKIYSTRHHFELIKQFSCNFVARLGRDEFEKLQEPRVWFFGVQLALYVVANLM